MTSYEWLRERRQIKSEKERSIERKKRWKKRGINDKVMESGGTGAKMRMVGVANVGEKYGYK